jgi:hypothetical protein
VSDSLAHKLQWDKANRIHTREDPADADGNEVMIFSIIFNPPRYLFLPITEPLRILPQVVT